MNKNKHQTKCLNFDLESLFPGLFIIPEILPPQHYRFFAWASHIYFLALVMHFFTLLLFVFVGEKVLIYFNIGSCFLFYGLIKLNLKGYLTPGIFLGSLEVMLHASLCTILFGWNSGFHYYILALPFVIFFLPFYNNFLKSLMVGIIFCCYVALTYYGSHYLPLKPKSDSFLLFFQYVNIFFIFFSFGIIAHYYNTVATNAEIVLKKAHQRSEDLLHNILPKTVAIRLKSEIQTIADGFQETTILFSDIVGFTKLSERISPQELVKILNEIFSQFDDLLEQLKLEKIKTIGDAYMVAAGVPEPHAKHAEAIAQMAFGMRNVIRSFNQQSKTPLEIRIGINSGPVVAGVIGKKKFIYDLWGDTVNTASRMESHGVPGEIHVSQSSYDLLKNKFKFEGRGIIQIKGKGEMETYFLQE